MHTANAAAVVSSEVFPMANPGAVDAKLVTISNNIIESFLMNMISLFIVR
jgi:hypothetical protein